MSGGTRRDKGKRDEFTTRGRRDSVRAVAERGRVRPWERRGREKKIEGKELGFGFRVCIIFIFLN